MKSLGDLADVRPIIVIDSREQAPLAFTLPTVVGTLTSGDYSALGLETTFSIERKSLNDLTGSLTADRPRFLRELERLRGFPFARLLIIGTPAQIEAGDYRSHAEPKAILHSLYSIEAKFCPVVFAATPEAGARLVERWAYWNARAVVEASNELLRAHRRYQRAAATPNRSRPLAG